jgi:regulator of protease activity HflC (stomatin/prohibitin superfamily)
VSSFFMTFSLTKALLYAIVGSFIILFVAQRALGKRGRSVPPRLFYGLPIAALVLAVIASSIMVVDVGTVRVVTVFGRVKERSYEQGLHFIFPGARHEFMGVRRMMFELSGASLDDPAPAAGAADAQRTVALSLDRIPLAIDVNFPYRLNPDLAWKVFANVGPGFEAELLAPAARAALREAAAGFTWTDAVTTKRAEMEERIHSVFQKLVSDNLVGAGFSKNEAAEAISLMSPQIRRLSPPRRILTAVGEVLAAEEDLKRQAILTQIAEREADRRANEGLGVKKLLEQLPKAFAPGQIRELLYALADKQRADTMLKAVEKDQVKVIVMGNGNATPAVTVPTP